MVLWVGASPSTSVGTSISRTSAPAFSNMVPTLWKSSCVLGSTLSQSEVRAIPIRGFQSRSKSGKRSQASSGSFAQIEASTAAPATSRANTPPWSFVGLKGRAPTIERRPHEGLNPTTPQNAAGRMTEPFVCVPMAPGTRPQATAAADPIDDPPGVRCVFQGLTVGPGWK